MLAVLVAVPTIMQNLLHPLSTSAIFWILWCRKDNRGRRTDNPSGYHPIWTISTPTSIIAPIFMLNALSAATLPIHPGLGQTLTNAGLHTWWLEQQTNKLIRKSSNINMTHQVNQDWPTHCNFSVPRLFSKRQDVNNTGFTHQMASFLFPNQKVKAL